MRARDERFANRDKHTVKADVLWDKRPEKKKDRLFTPKDFYHDERAGVCICPAGEFLYQNASHIRIQGKEAVKFTAAKRVCGPCDLRAQCLRHPDKTPVRQVVFFTGVDHNRDSHIEAMKQRIDSEEGRQQYGRRIGTVELVFGNMRCNKKLNRFTPRGRRKVDTQWKLYCLVHNIEKLANNGYAQ